MSDSDPFLIDQAALEAKLKLLQENFDRWRQIRDCHDVAEFVACADEFNWLCMELSQGIKNAGWDLDDLEETLKLMAENRQASLTDAEHLARRGFIANTRQLLSQISGEVLPSGRVTGVGGGGGVGGSGVSATASNSLGGGGVGDPFVEEPANLDLLDPSGFDSVGVRGGGGGGGISGGGRGVAAWKRRLGAAVTFGPLRQMGLSDGGGGPGVSGRRWPDCLMRHRFRLLVGLVFAVLLALLIAGIVTAAQRDAAATGGGGTGDANGTSTVASLPTSVVK